MFIHPIHGAYAAGPTSCVAHPTVVKNIVQEIRRAGAISAHEIRLASLMGLAPTDSRSMIGYNDGVIYPTDVGPVLAPAPGLSPLRMMSLAPLAIRKMHALALLVDFSDNVGVRPAADFQKLL